MSADRPAAATPTTPTAPTVDALIVAAGRGVRAGGGLAKQYRPLAGRPVLARTAARFLAHPGIARVQVVIADGDEPLLAQACEGLALPAPAIGGASRQESVHRGLRHLAEAPEGPPDLVLIHDAARPFVPAALIDRVLAAAAAHGAAIPAEPVTDTLKRVDAAGDIVETTPRDGLYGAQTPQGFRFADILAAHERAADSGIVATDDAALLEAEGRPVARVRGSPDNLKLTTEADFARAEIWLAGHRETRVGSGFDVHRFGPGDHVTLCGVAIPHDRALEGHSDADVGLHAVTDAILGALALGDIGNHFPPSDPRWKGVDSAHFLAHAVALAVARGGRIAHLDVTLICQAPKIGPHRAAMQARIAEIAGIAPDRVSVKATTTERLGFTGRGEGIAAQAVATLSVETPEDF